MAFQLPKTPYLVQSIIMKQKDLDYLKACNDAMEYHLIGKYYYRAGTHGLSRHDKKSLRQVGHCNGFRDKILKEVLNDLKQIV